MSGVDSWYEVFISKCDLAVFFEQDQDSLRLSIGEGIITVCKSSLAISIGSDCDDLVRSIFHKMAVDVPYKDLSEVLAAFEDICVEASDQMDQGAGSEDDSEAYGYTYDNDDGNGECADEAQVVDKQAGWIEEHHMKKRWELKEVQLREEKAEEQLKSIFPNRAPNNIFSSAASSKILTNDLLSFMKSPVDLGYQVNVVDDNIHHWTVKLAGFHPGTELCTDLAILDSKFGYNSVEIEMTFAVDLFPFYPPIVTIVRPRFEGFMLGKIASLKCLQLSNWDPLIGVKNCIENIRKELEFNGRLLIDHPLNGLENNSAYSKLEHQLLKLGIVCEVKPRAFYDNKLYIGAGADADNNNTVTNKMDCGFLAKTRNSAASMLDIHVPALKEDIPDPEVPEEEKVEQDAKRQKKHWAKGTGYGSGNNEVKWDVAAFEAAKVEKDRLQIVLLKDIAEQIKIHTQPQLLPDTDTQKDAKSESKELKELKEHKEFDVSQLYQVVEESCLLPYIQQFVQTDSLLELQRHLEINLQAFAILELLSTDDSLKPLLNIGINQNIGHIVSLRESCDAMEKKISTYFRTISSSHGGIKVYSGTKADKNEVTEIKDIDKLRKSAHKDDLIFMQYLLQVLKLVQSAVNSVDQMDISTLNNIYKEKQETNGSTMKANISGSGSGKNENNNENENSPEQEYKDAMLDLQYDEVEDLPSFHYSKQASKVGVAATLKERTKRLAQEHADLSHSLPLSLSSSVWVRVSTDRMDMMQSIISGPEGTPYESGLFLFDTYFVGKSKIEGSVSLYC